MTTKTVESLMALADEYAASCSNGNTLGDNPLRAALREALAQPAAEPDERAAFEVWALSDDGGWWPEAVRRVGEGYHAGAVTKQWKGWQARAMKAKP